MTQAASRPVSDVGSDDIVLPFAVGALDIRGRLTRLGPSIDRILARHDYPAPIARLLGEAAVLAILLGSALKDVERFQLQALTDGVLDMLVVDFELPDRLRAFARFDAERLKAEPGASLAQILGRGRLAFTIDQGSETTQYQGVTPIDGQGLEDAAHRYFLQSEQIPTLVRLAVAEEMSGGARTWRAGGLLVQFLPSSSERMRTKDLDPGDAPADVPSPAEVVEDDAWSEAKALAATVEDHELVDPNLSSERLLFRLFHERGVTVFDPRHVREACRCSDARVRSMLRSFSAQDRADMVDQDGKITVTCEFCSTTRVFAPSEFEETDAGED
jgi:molecular chaperone Hsp33